MMLVISLDQYHHEKQYKEKSDDSTVKDNEEELDDLPLLEGEEVKDRK